jgi:hypothetical protein
MHKIHNILFYEKNAIKMILLCDTLYMTLLRVTASEDHGSAPFTARGLTHFNSCNAENFLRQA